MLVDRRVAFLFHGPERLETGRFLAHYNLSIRYWDKGEAFELGAMAAGCGVTNSRFEGQEMPKRFSWVLFWDEVLRCD